MKLFLPLLTVFLIAASSSIGNASPTGPAKGRLLTELQVIPTRVLKRSISPKFYKSLTISPVEGWVIVRATLSGTRLWGARVIRSDLGGAFDGLALQRAKEVLISANYTTDRPNLGSSILLHLLIYNIADGTMALSFAHLDEPGGDQADYYGCARLAVLKADGKWTEIKGPEGLEGKGWVIRRGIKQNLEATLRMEPKIPH
ncbi:MAG TPA: hypothetical protein VLO30_04000 [Chthoniobacterales bacterium]|nr:hypothetical protein [Chthoniobacterales bacterium]